MQIKKFVAPSLKEATQQRKQELGLDAIILGTRAIEGEKRFNMKKMYEITAGMDEPSRLKSSKTMIMQNTSQKSLNLELDELTKKIFGKNEPQFVSGDYSSRKEKQS